MKKTEKIISIVTVLAILMYVFVLPASAALLGKDGFYYEFENGNAVLKEYHSSNTEVVIPSDVYEHDVVAIDDYTFLRNTDIVSVTIPDTVTSIGSSAFYGCTSLESVVIPESVTSFGNSVFAACENVTVYCYPDSAAEAYAINNSIPYEVIKSYAYGDVDFNGDINSVDSLMILRRSVGLEDFTDVQDTLADVDGNGIVTSADALDVLRYSVKLPVMSSVGNEVEM